MQTLTRFPWGCQQYLGKTESVVGDTCGFGTSLLLYMLAVLMLWGYNLASFSHRCQCYTEDSTYDEGNVAWKSPFTSSLSPTAFSFSEMLLRGAALSLWRGELLGRPECWPPCQKHPISLSMVWVWTVRGRLLVLPVIPSGFLFCILSFWDPSL